MSVRVGFVRAVNLGRRRVAMTRLVAVCEGLGYADVWTYVNSGNVVFDTTGARASVEAAMQEALADEFGFECTTFVRTATQVRNILDARPFTLAAGDTHFVTFLKKAPSLSDAQRLEGLSNDFDTLVVHGAEVHWRMRGRSTDSHLVKRDWEKVLGPLSSTSRNVTMLTKLAAKIDAAQVPAVLTTKPAPPVRSARHTAADAVGPGQARRATQSSSAGQRLAHWAETIS